MSTQDLGGRDSGWSFDFDWEPGVWQEGQLQYYPAYTRSESQEEQCIVGMMPSCQHRIVAEMVFWVDGCIFAQAQYSTACTGVYLLYHAALHHCTPHQENSNFIKSS